MPLCSFGSSASLFSSHYVWLLRITNIDTTFAQTMGLPDLSPDGVAATLGPLAQLAALNFE